MGVNRQFDEVPMGRSQLEKQKTHEKIVETASKRLREEGLDGIGVV